MGPERCTKRGWEEGAPRRVLARLRLSWAQVAARWGRVLTLGPWLCPGCPLRAGVEQVPQPGWGFPPGPASQVSDAERPPHAPVALQTFLGSVCYSGGGG